MKNRAPTELTFIDDKYRLWLLIWHTRAAISKARHKKFGRYLHPNQAAALVNIWSCHGRATPAMLSRLLFLEPHSTSELIIRMEKKGLVKRKKDRKKGNLVRISITPKGRALCTKVVQADYIRGLISSLTAEQQQQLRDALWTLFKAVLKELGTEGEIPPLLKT